MLSQHLESDSFINLSNLVVTLERGKKSKCALRGLVGINSTLWWSQVMESLTVGWQQQAYNEILHLRATFLGFTMLFLYLELISGDRYMCRFWATPTNAPSTTSMARKGWRGHALNLGVEPKASPMGETRACFDSTPKMRRRFLCGFSVERAHLQGWEATLISGITSAPTMMICLRFPPPNRRKNAWVVSHNPKSRRRQRRPPPSAQSSRAHSKSSSTGASGRWRSLESCSIRMGMLSIHVDNNKAPYSCLFPRSRCFYLLI